MGKVLTQAQKTFTDLYDSYVLNLSSDIVAVPCNQDGQSVNNHETTVTYNAVADSASIGVTCTGIVEGTSLEGVQYDISNEGKIIITVPKDLVLPDDAETGFIFTTNNSSQFVFKKYVTFIKIQQGTDGENARSFQIVSTQGDTFDEGISEITMTAMAFDGTTQLNDVTYAWYRYTDNKWVPVLNNNAGVGEGDISDEHIFTGQSLTIKKTEAHDNPVFRCVVTYSDNETDEDYFQLKNLYHNYESTVKFFGGTSTIDSYEPFVVAYIELYKDHQKANAIDADYYFYDKDNVKAKNGGLSINFNKIDQSYKIDQNLIYAIYKDESAFTDSKSDSYTITVQTSPSTWGTVTGGGTYVYGTNITLTAAPASGYVFDKWTDGSTENPRSITVTNNATYTASFAVQQSTSYTITAQANQPMYGSAHVNKQSTGTYVFGETVTLTATANTGYVFVDWYEDGVAKHWPKSINIEVTNTRTLIAHFRPISSDSGVTDSILLNQDKTIDVYKNQITYLAFTPTANGTYRFYHKENMLMDAYLYNSDMSVMLTSSEGVTDDDYLIEYRMLVNQTYYFGVKLNDNENFSAGEVLVHLEKTTVSNQYAVVLDSNGGGFVSGHGAHEKGSVIPIEAEAADGYEFDYWQDSSGNKTDYDRKFWYTVNNDLYLKAIFTPITTPDGELMQYVISTSVDPDAAYGTASDGGTYLANANVVLTAEPAQGYRFIGWYVDNVLQSVEKVYTFKATQTAIYVARFEKKQGITVELIKQDTNDNYDDAVGFYVYNDESYDFNTSYGTITSNGVKVTLFDTDQGYLVCAKPDKNKNRAVEKVDLYANGEFQSTVSGTELSEIVDGVYLIGMIPNDTMDDGDSYQLLVYFKGSATTYFDVTTETIPISTGTVSGGGPYASGDFCTVTAQPNPGCTFSHWFKYLNGNTGNPDEIIQETNPYTFQVTCDTRMMAVFDGTPSGGSGTTTQYTINVVSSDTTKGAVSGGGTYDSGTQITITATPQSGYTFLWWISSDGDTTDEKKASRTITVDSNKTYTAYFEEIHEPVTITVLANDDSYGTVSGGGIVEYGQTISISAQANPGYQFDHWDDNGNSQNPRSITAYWDTTYIAVFTTKPIDVPTYTIETKVEPSGSGEAAGWGDYPKGSTCTVEAVANDGYKFDHWEVTVPGVAGVTTITDRSYTFTVDGSAIYTACFTEYHLTVVVQADPEVGGTVTQSGTGTYGEGDVIKVTAKASDGYEFAGWYENRENKSNSATYQFAVLRNYTLVARFTAIDHEPSETEDRIIDGVLYVGTETTQINSPAYKNNSEIYSVVIPDSIVTPIGNSAFENCTYLQSITIGKNVTSIGSFAFQGCKRLTSIEIPNNVTSLDGYAFYQCTGLTQVTLGSGISIISNSAFRDCTSLQCVIMSKSVTSIKDIAFYQCNNLTDVYYEGTESDWAAISIGGSNNPLTKATIHYNYTTTYAASPMMMRSAAPMTLSLEDNSVTAYAADDDTDRRARYKAALCKYNASISDWQIIDDSDDYVYRNDLYSDVLTKVIVVSKEDVANYRSVDVVTYKKVLDVYNNIVFDNDLIVSNTSFTVFDVNDPIMQSEQPVSANEGQLWLDTSKNPYVLYIYQKGKWVYFNQQEGKTIYTTRPETYSVGDIWILDEDQYDYGKGTMLTAIAAVTVPGGFNITHWTDANPGTSSVIKNIVEHFDWDSTGIKISHKITSSSGQTETPFYVHIDSQKMGFHSVSGGEDTEVVHIGNKSATIQNATFEGTDGTTFKNNAHFHDRVEILNENSSGVLEGFAFQTEEDGSFSLILART